MDPVDDPLPVLLNRQQREQEKRREGYRWGAAGLPNMSPHRRGPEETWEQAWRAAHDRHR